MCAIATTTKSSDEVFDPWLSYYQWNVDTLTYSFPKDGSYSIYNNDSAFVALNDAQQDAVRSVLGEVSSFSGLSFTEVEETSGSHGLMTFTGESGLSGGYAYNPGNWDSAGDAVFGSKTSAPTSGNEAYLYFTHEIGHALGLEHGHEYNEFVASGFDSQEYTVVTYTDYVGDTHTNSYDSGPVDWAQTYQQLDIAALQFMYGANFAETGETWSGDTVYTFDPTTGEMSVNGVGQGTPAGNRVFRTIWDGHGEDTYDLGNYADDLNIDLRPGSWSTFCDDQLADLNKKSSEAKYLAKGNVANALLYQDDLRSLIENATGGSGNDVVVGNEAANFIIGNDGDDTLSGGDEDDHLRGNNGNDILRGDAGDDTLRGGWGADVLEGGEGRDRLVYHGSGAGVTIDLGANTAQGGEAAGDVISGFEVVVGSGHDDTLTGSSTNNVLIGGGGDDILNGGAGNDKLRGGAGADQMDGGDGSDLVDYRGSDFSVSVNLKTNTAIGGDATGDTILSIEGIIGSAFDDILIGNDQRNRLFGGEGDDTLSGEGGKDVLRGSKGGDTLDGGTGFDTLDYRGSDFGVSINLETETASGGDATGDIFVNFEGIIGSDHADTLAGDGGSNQIRAGDGDDVIDGGAGNDDLRGEDGNDLFVFDLGSDLIDGGSGDDVAVYIGNISDYSVTNSGVGDWIVTSLATNDIDTLVDVETLTFDDGSVTWSDFQV